MDASALSRKYVGDCADKYDDERKGRPQWRAEEVAVDRALAMLPAGARVIDVPVGTGRFCDLYAKYGLRVTGVDTSADMLRIAERKAATAGVEAELEAADIRRLPYADGRFDAAVCIRLFQWFGTDDIVAALTELARVSRGPVIFGAPSYRPLRQALSPSGAVRYLKQLKFRFYCWRTRADHIVHEPHVIPRAAAAAGLVITHTHPIAMRKYEYAVYIAEKR